MTFEDFQGQVEDYFKMQGVFNTPILNENRILFSWQDTSQTYMAVFDGQWSMENGRGTIGYGNSLAEAIADEARSYREAAQEHESHLQYHS